MWSARDHRWIVRLGIAALVACNGSEKHQAGETAAGSAGSGVPASAGVAATGSGSAGTPTTISTEPMPNVVRYTPDVITMTEPAIELPRQESFRVLDAGKGARARLRYALAAGSVAFTTQSELSAKHLEHGQLSAPAVLPAIRDGFAITVIAGAPGRLALRALRGAAAGTSAEADAYLATWRGLLEGRTITVAIDDRGQLSTIQFNDDPGNARSARAKDELVQRLLSIVVPLPAEPVGVGARWQVVTILRQGPAYAKQTATYTLIARGATGWKLHVVLQRVGEQQRITDPALPAGTTAELVALFRALEGDVEADPAHALITGGSLTIESRLHVRLTPAGAPAAQASEQIFEDTGRATFAHDP